MNYQLCALFDDKIPAEIARDLALYRKLGYVENLQPGRGMKALYNMTDKGRRKLYEYERHLAKQRKLK